MSVKQATSKEVFYILGNTECSLSAESYTRTCLIIVCYVVSTSSWLSYLSIKTRNEMGT